MYLYLMCAICYVLLLLVGFIIGVFSGRTGSRVSSPVVSIRGQCICQLQWRLECQDLARQSSQLCSDHHLINGLNYYLLKINSHLLNP